MPTSTIPTWCSACPTRSSRRVDVRPWAERKLASMRAHETQVGDLGPFLALPVDVFREAMGTEFFIRRCRPTTATTTSSPAWQRPAGDHARPLTGAEVADRIAAALARRRRRPGRPMARYMRDQFAFLGVMAPAQKDAWREVAADLPRPARAVVVEAATALWDRPSASTSTSPARWSTATPPSRRAREPHLRSSTPSRGAAHHQAVVGHRRLAGQPRRACAGGPPQRATASHGCLAGR